MNEDFIDELTSINASLEERIKELESQLNSNKAINSQLSEDAKMQDNIITRLQERIKELEGRTKTQIDVAKEIKGYKDTIIRLEDAVKEHDRNESAYTELSKKVIEREETINGLMAASVKLQHENTKLRVANDSLRQVNDMSASRIADLTGNIDALNAKVDDLQKQLHVTSTIVYCDTCGENTSRVEDECVGCIKRERAEKCEESEPFTNIEQKLDTPLGTKVTESTECSQCDSLRELNGEYSEIIAALTAQLAKAYKIKK